MSRPLAALLRSGIGLDQGRSGAAAPQTAGIDQRASLAAAALRRQQPRTIYLVAGDVSGDLHGGHLARAIRAAAPHVRLVGVGGDTMRAAGVEVQIDTTRLSVVGVWEALRMGHDIVRTYRQVQGFVADIQPDLAILIDSETVVVPAARWLKRRGVPVVFFFPPQIWFWGRWRRHRVAPLAARVISAFRPEADLYREAGANTVWVGHPLQDLVHVSEHTDTAMQAVGLDPSRPLVALMPGSRRREIRALLRPMLHAARLLQQRDPQIQFALPLASDTFRREIEEAARASGLRRLVVYRPRSYAVLSRARVILQCSGTATLEAALLGIPSVIVYRCLPIEYLAARLFMHVDFIGMPNILLGEMVQPEFFHRGANPERMADAVGTLLTDERRWHAVHARLRGLRDVLGPPGAFDRAAQAILDLLLSGGDEPAAAETRHATADDTPR